MATERIAIVTEVHNGSDPGQDLARITLTIRTSPGSRRNQCPCNAVYSLYRDDERASVIGFGNIEPGRIIFTALRRIIGRLHCTHFT